MTLLRTLLWIATTGAAFAASLGLARRLLPGRPSERLAWGFAGVMTLAVVEVVALGLVWKIYTLPVLLCVELGLVGAAIWWTREDLRAEALEWLARLRHLRAQGLSVVSFAALALAGVVWSACLVFTFESPFPGVDAAAYHLPIAVKIVERRGLEVYDVRATHANEFPRDGQMNFARTIAMTRDERPVRAVQWCAGLAAVAALFAWMRHWGAGRALAAALAPMFLLVPAVISQAMVLWGTIDLIFHALLILVFTMVSWVPRDQGAAYRRTLWTALAAALAIGTKGQGLAICAAALAPLAAVLLARRYRPAWYLDVGAHAAAILLVIGLPQYVQNYWTFGNPFAPIEVAVGGTVVFPGRYKSIDALIEIEPATGTQSSVRALARSWGLEPAARVKELGDVTRRIVWTKDWVYDEVRLGGWGPAWLLALLPGMLLGTGVLVAQRRWHAASMAGLLVALLVAMPGGWWARFSLFQFGGALVLLSVFAARLPWRAATHAVVLWTLLVSGASAAEAYRAIRDKNLLPELKPAPGKYLQSLDTYRPHADWESREDLAVHRWVRDEMAPDAAFVYFHPHVWGVYHYYFYNHTFSNRVHGLGRPASAEDMEEKLRARRADFFMVLRGTPEYELAIRFGAPVLEAGKYAIYRVRLPTRPRAR